VSASPRTAAGRGSELARALAAAGGADAPPAATAQLRGLLLAALRHGRHELARPRSGYEEPVPVAFAVDGERVLAATPADAGFRVDPQLANERTWLLLAAATGALADLADPAAPAGPGDLTLGVGDVGGFLVLGLPAPGLDPQTLEELAGIAFGEQARGIDRLRAHAHVVPGTVLAEPGLRPPVGAGHPLRIAEALARLGGRPAEARSLEEHEDEVFAVVSPPSNGPARPHEDPVAARRAARRILQRLDGMGKWGGYHTDFAHLARGFAGNDRALAQAVGEALLAAELLQEKPSVGQRHVYLNPSRAGDIRRLIEDGELPGGLVLPD
jgi:hypothetical protein